MRKTRDINCGFNCERACFYGMPYNAVRPVGPCRFIHYEWNVLFVWKCPYNLPLLFWTSKIHKLLSFNQGTLRSVFTHRLLSAKSSTLQQQVCCKLCSSETNMGRVGVVVFLSSSSRHLFAVLNCAGLAGAGSIQTSTLFESSLVAYQARMPCRVPWQGVTTDPWGAWLCVCAPRIPKFMFTNALALLLLGGRAGKLE